MRMLAKTGWRRLGRHAAPALLLALAAGCGTAGRNAGTEDRDRYIAFCRETALAPGAEAVVHPCPATDREFRRAYKVAYADERHLSFCCSDFAYAGGAHGSATVTVGTIDRKTGRILTLGDVPAFADREALKRRLKDAVVARIGKDALLDEVRPHDNFYLAEDGWHFVFNACEVACHAAGAVEVVVGR